MSGQSKIVRYAAESRDRFGHLLYAVDSPSPVDETYAIMVEDVDNPKHRAVYAQMTIDRQIVKEHGTPPEGDN